MPDFRVTVEDLGTGDTAVVETYLGDYLLIPFGSCYLAHVLESGKTRVLTVKGWAPEGEMRWINAIGGDAT